MNFRILGLPRSGTSWAANWLTSDGALCLHDPLAHCTLDQLAQQAHTQGRVWGVSCTALWMFPKFLTANPCRTVILERPLEEVNQSLRAINFPQLPSTYLTLFRMAEGLRVPYTALFERQSAEEIWHYLRPGVPFDAQRWELLQQLTIEPNLRVWAPNPHMLTDALQQFQHCPT